jgi:hypothetical protein
MSAITAPPRRAPAVTASRSDRPCKLLDWKPFHSSALIGKATIAFQGGWIVSNIPIFRLGDAGVAPIGGDSADNPGGEL